MGAGAAKWGVLHSSISGRETKVPRGLSSRFLAAHCQAQDSGLLTELPALKVIRIGSGECVRELLGPPDVLPPPTGSNAQTLGLLLVIYTLPRGPQTFPEPGLRSRTESEPPLLLAVQPGARSVCLCLGFLLCNVG